MGKRFTFVESRIWSTVEQHRCHCIDEITRDVEAFAVHKPAAEEEPKGI